MKIGTGEKTILLLAGVVLVVAGLRFSGPLLIPLCLAMVIAAVSVPIIRWLERVRVPHVLAILLAVALDLAVLAGMISLLGTSLNEFYKALPRYQARIVSVLREDIAWLDAHGVHLSQQLNEQITSISSMMDLVGALLASVMSAITTALLVSLLAVFILFEIRRWKLKIRYAMGDPEADLRRFASAAYELQKYLFVKTAISLLTGVLCGSWCAIIGLDFPVLWGLIAFLLNYIPTIGSILAGIPPVVLAWVLFGPGAALGTAIGYLAVNFILGNLVEPRLMGRALGLSPLVVLLSMVFWWWLWGPIGALLSAPLTMGVKIALSQTSDLRWIAILLGSTRWVEETYTEWIKAKPVLSSRAERLCLNPDNANDDACKMIRCSNLQNPIRTASAEPPVAGQSSAPPAAVPRK